jgi:Metallo-beta-lactamase superfamily
VLFELGVNARGQAEAVIDHARTLAPGKPVTQLIISHHHFDHTAGFREAIAEGLTIIQRPTSGVVFRETATHPAPDFPDDLGKNPKPLKFIAAEEHLQGCTPSTDFPVSHNSSCPLGAPRRSLIVDCLRHAHASSDHENPTICLPLAAHSSDGVSLLTQCIARGSVAAPLGYPWLCTHAPSLRLVRWR